MASLTNGHEGAVDGEAGLVLGRDLDLAQVVAESDHGVVGLLRGAQPADDLDALLHGHRVHEVHPHVELGLAVGRGQAGHGDAGGVGGQELVVARLGQLAVDVLFEFGDLGRRFDNGVARHQVGDGRGRGEPSQGLGLLVLGDALLALGFGVGLHQPVQRPVDVAHAALQDLVVDVHHEGLESALGGDLGDAVAHGADADDADLLQVAFHRLLRGGDLVAMRGSGRLGYASRDSSAARMRCILRSLP
jgi:hypothetical protein